MASTPNTVKCELVQHPFDAWGDDPLPYYIEPESPITTPELMDEYPLVLTTGARTTAYFHSEKRQIPYTRELNPDPLTEMHPEPARRTACAEGDWMRV